jgi:hypothetical protein
MTVRLLRRGSFVVGPAHVGVRAVFLACRIHCRRGDSGASSFNAPPGEAEGESDVVVFAVGRFDGAALLAMKAAEGCELFDEQFGLVEARFNGEVAEVERELQAADEVLLGDRQRPSTKLSR